MFPSQSLHRSLKKETIKHPFMGPCVFTHACAPTHTPIHLRIYNLKCLNGSLNRTVPSNFSYKFVLFCFDLKPPFKFDYANAVASPTHQPPSGQSRQGLWGSGRRRNSGQIFVSLGMCNYFCLQLEVLMKLTEGPSTCATVIIVTSQFINIDNRKTAKWRPDIINIVIWAASPGSYKFTPHRDPPAHALQITGG